MNFKHACFISYRNGDRNDKGLSARRIDINDTLNAFASDLRDELAYALNTRITPRDCLVFLDQDQKCLDKGNPLLQTFSSGICNSVCMVVIFTGHYLDREKLTCAAELEGMLRRLRKRCQQLGHEPERSTDWIFTAVFRESYRVPDILNKNLRFDFTDYEDSSKPLRDNSNFRTQITAMANKIADFWEGLREESDPSINNDCASFKLLDPMKPPVALISFVEKHRKPFIPEDART